VWFSGNDRADEDARYALADTLTRAKLMTDTLPIDDDANANLRARQVKVADGLANIWSMMAMERLNFLLQVSVHGKACPQVYHAINNRVEHSLLKSSVGRYQQFKTTWTARREAIQSGTHKFTLDELKKLVAPGASGIRDVAKVAKASGHLLVLGEEGVETLRELLLEKNLQVVSSALEMRVQAEKKPSLLLPFVSELVTIVTTPYEGDDDKQALEARVETQASRLLELLAQDHASELGWENGDLLRSALASGIVRGQRARSMIATVVQAIAANRESAKPEKSSRASKVLKKVKSLVRRPSSGLVELASDRRLVAAGQQHVSGDGINDALNFLSDTCVQMGGVGQVDLFGLLDTFNCEGYTEDGSMKFACEGAPDYATVASSALLVASAVASASGFGLPVATVLSVAGKIVGLWGHRGPKLPEFQHDVLLMLRQAVDEVKTFHLQYDMADALAKSIVLSDHVEMLKLDVAIEDCGSPTAVAWFGAVDRVDEESAQAMAAILSQAQLATSMKPDQELGLDSLKRHVEILDGFTSSWSNLAMGRLRLLVEAAAKSKGCARYQEHVEYRMRHNLLGSMTDRFREHEAKMKSVRASYKELIYDLEVKAIREALSSWFFSNWFDPDTVALYAPQLVQLGKPGVAFVEEFLTNHDWKVVAAVFEVSTLEVLRSNKLLVPPLAPALAKLFLNKWHDKEDDGETLALVGRVHSEAAKLLDHIPERHLKTLKGSDVEKTLNEAITSDNIRRKDAKQALERVVHNIGKL